MFHCQFCTFTTGKLKHHIDHGILHADLNSNFFCGFHQCKKYFRLEVSLRSHLARTHNFRFKHVNLNTEPKIIARIANANARYICSEKLCKKEFYNHRTVVKHLECHIRDGARIKCPFHDCEKICDKLNSFTSHLYKNHKHLQLTPLQKPLQKPSNVNPPNEQIPTSCDNVLVQQSDEGSEKTELLNIIEDVERKSSPTDLFLINLAQFFLKIETLFLIPVSTIQYIVSQTCTIHEKGQEIVKNNILARLLEENFSAEQAQNAINQAFHCDPFSQVERKLGTRFKRREFYMKNFPYVKPVRVWLGDKNNRTNFFHYVPLKKTLLQLFDNKSLKNELRGYITQSEDNVLKDFTDGSVFQQNQFFKKHPNALKLILYQDSFEVVNPLGAAKKKIKILAVYLNIGNFPDHIRSHVNSMQLVAICREKLFDHEKVYGRIVKDLKEIETEGVRLSSGEIITGAVVFIAGDNLGSHSLGGFVENFSSPMYFCRYCLMRRDEFYSEGGPFKYYEKRTIESYKNAIKHIENRNIQADENDEVEIDETKSYQDDKGIKFNSVFNQLDHYHVCSPGLPLCLGHDVLEGIIAYDTKLCIDNLVRRKWFSYKTLNKRIDSFKYSKLDNRDRPCSILAGEEKISGGAWQLWTFLRLLPLFIEDKIQDIHDDVWKSLILLTEVVEVICAPEIHKSCISYLRLIIDEYIHLRQKLQKPLRPKHHFLLHCPELILKFGPLMKVWTLRFKNKHTFFNRVIRCIKNSNVTKSLSIKHELFQSFIRSGGDIRCEIEMKMNTKFEARHYNEQILEAVNSVNLPDNIQDCKKIIINGVHYEKGDALFISQESYQYKIEVGRILIPLCDEKNVFIVVQVFETIFRLHLRAYQLGKFLRYECLPFHSLPSTESLHIYNLGTYLCVKPNYGLVRRHL